MDLKLKQIVKLLDEEKNNEAKLLFQSMNESNTVEYWLIKGKLEQKFQNWSNAINSYNKVLDLDKNNSEAINNLQIVKNILNFWNPEMFNP